MANLPPLPGTATTDQYRSVRRKQMDPVTCPWCSAVLLPSMQVPKSWDVSTQKLEPEYRNQDGALFACPSCKQPVELSIEIDTDD